MTQSQPGIRAHTYGDTGVLVVLGPDLAGIGVGQMPSIDIEAARMSALSDNATRTSCASSGFWRQTCKAALRYKVSAAPTILKAGYAADAQIADLLQASAAATVSGSSIPSSHGLTPWYWLSRPSP